MKFLFLRKFLISAVFAVSGASILFAQDFDAADDGSADGFDSFESFSSFSSFDETAEASPLSFGAEMELTARGMLGGDSLDGLFNDGDARDIVFVNP